MNGVLIAAGHSYSPRGMSLWYVGPNSVFSEHINNNNKKLDVFFWIESVSMTPIQLVILSLTVYK